MPKIRVYANYEFTNDSDNCYDNGELSMLAKYQNRDENGMKKNDKPG